MAVYEITTPNGEVFEIEGPDDADPSAVIAQISGQQSPQQQAQGDGRPVGDLSTAVSEPLAAIGSGAIATPLAGLAGIAGTLLPGEQGQGARWTEAVQGALTYQPRSKAGQAVTDAISYPFEKLAEGTDWVGAKSAELTGSPLIGAAVKTALDAAPALAARRGTVKHGNSASRSPGSAAEKGKATAPDDAPAPAKRPAGLDSVPKAVPSLEELKSQATAAYKRADEAGIVVKENSLKGLKTRIVAITKKEGIDKDLHPDSSAALNRIIKSKGELTLSEIETLRKIASDAKGSLKPSDRRLASKIVDELDDYLDNLSDADVIAGDATKAKALKEARELYSRTKKAEEINTLVQRATDSAANFSGSGMENALRTEFRNLAKNEKRMRRFTKEEQAAIRKVAQGGKLENSMRFIGKFAPTGVVSGVLSGGFGALVAGPFGAALPAAGVAGRHVATKLTRRNADAAEALMRRGPPSKPARQRATVDEPTPAAPAAAAPSRSVAAIRADMEKLGARAQRMPSDEPFDSPRMKAIEAEYNRLRKELAAAQAVD